MNNYLVMRNDRWGVTTSTSSLAIANHTGILESIILYGLTAAGVSGAALNLFVPILTAVAVTAISIGLNYLLAPKPPKPEDGKAPKAQAIPPRIFGVGTNRVGGYYMLWEEKDNYLISVQAMCGHKISSYQRLWLQDDIVVLSDTPVDGMYPTVGGADGRYADNVILIDHRLGLESETPYSSIVSRLSGSGVWTNNHKGNSIASIGMICRGVSSKHFQERFPYGIPQASYELDMAECWDFRDSSQDPENPSTWTFTKNVAVCFVWWLCFCPYGPKADYKKAILPVIDRWKEEADICDEDVAIDGGGTEKRYEVNGWATTETDPIATLNCFLNACDGHIAQRGDGALILTVGKFREELVETIYDADIVGHFKQTDIPEEDEINRLVAQFTYPATDYTTSVTDYFEDSSAQMKIGRVLPQTADYTWVHSWRQARRLLKREWLRNQTKLAGSFDLQLSAVNAVTARWVRCSTPLRMPSLNGKIIENRRATLSFQSGGWQMEWKKHPDNIDLWIPEDDEGQQPPVPVKPTSSGLPTPVIYSLTAVGENGSVYLKIQVVESDYNDSLAPVMRYRIKDIGDGTSGAWVGQPFDDVTPSGGYYTLNSSPVPNDKLLQVEVAWQASGGTLSDYSATEEIQSTVDSIAPNALLTFSASDGSGQFTVNFGTENDGHLVSVAIYKVATGGPIAPRPTPTARPSVSRGISYSIPITSSAGTFDVYAEPMNGSGIAGPLSGPVSVTVT